MAREVQVLVLLACAACSSAETDPLPPSPEHCPPPNRLLADGRCLAPGIQDDGCPAGETSQPEGGCRPAGIPPDDCADGFEPEDDSCAPILPAEPCGPGQLALPGDSECRAVAPCGDAPWGEIPVDATTQYVDASYDGGASDGSAAQPWVRIGDAVAAAGPGAIVAVAAGSYAEDLVVMGKAVRLWGICPERVEVVGGETGWAAVVVDAQADGTEIHDLAVRGPNIGVVISNATDVVLDGVWIHETGGFGVAADASLGPTRVTLSSSLLEESAQFGLFLDGAEATVRATAIRATRAPAGADPYGAGVHLQGSTSAGTRARLSLESSLLEENERHGLFVLGSDAAVEATAIRNTRPAPVAPQRGHGIDAEDDWELGERSTLEIRGSVVEHSRRVGVLIMGSDATLDGVAVRDTQPAATDQQYGYGVDVEATSDTAERSAATLRDSVIEGSHDTGLLVLGAEATLEGAIVRGTEPNAATSEFGRGVSVGELTGTAERAEVTLRSSLIADNREIGLFVSGSDVTLEGTVVRDTEPQLADGSFGRGINLQDDSVAAGRTIAVLRATVIERSHDVGLMALASDVEAEGLVVRRTEPSAAHGLFGFGIHVEEGSAAGTSPDFALRSSLVEHSCELGVSVWDAAASLSRVLIRETSTSPTDGLFGDGVAAVRNASTASLELLDSRIEASARAGAAIYGARADLRGSIFECNAIHLDCEPAAGASCVLNDLGDNQCGCAGQGVPCQAVTAGLSPPTAPPPAE